MTFGAPEWLWSLLAVPALALTLWLLAWYRRRRWRRVAHPRTARTLDLTRPSSRPAWRVALLLLATACVAVALARPRWGATEEEVHVRGLDVVIALDLSRSMLAEDLQPSRLAVAKSLARELGRRLPSDRVALLGFAASAGRLCPLTLDRAALELYLEAADPSVFPQQGTDLGAAIREARALFDERGGKRRILILISDGEDQESGAVAAAAEARAAEITIYAIGIGTASGAPIPERDEDGRVSGYVRDGSGQVVTSKLDETGLAAVAEATGGLYARTRGLGLGVEQIIETLGRLEREELAESLSVRKAERYRWPLAAAFLLVALEALLIDRRRRR